MTSLFIYYKLYHYIRHCGIYRFPINDYHYDKNAIANSLSFAKLGDGYYIICNTRVDDVIYVQIKTTGNNYNFKEILRTVCSTWTLARQTWMSITILALWRKENLPLMFFVLDQQWAKAVRTLQEQCTFLSDEGFINVLKCNAIEGIYCKSRDVKIVNELYGYSKAAADGKLKHPRKGIKMDRTTKDITALVPPKIMEHYSNVHCELDILFGNNVAFLLAKSRDIQFIHCKTTLTKSDRRVKNGLKSILLDYEARGFKVTTTFNEGEFKSIINWTRNKLHIDLTTCAADLHVPRAENAIKFIKGRVRCV